MKERLELEPPGVQESDSVALTATAVVLPYKDSCQFGEDGLLRDLLLNKANHYVFGSYAVQAIVEFKWRSAYSMFFELCGV